MSIETKLIVPVVAILTPNPDMSTKRVETLKNDAEIINNRRKERIANDGAFGTIMATPASDKFKGIVNFTGTTNGGRDADDIYSMQRSKMGRAYNKYNDGLDRQFEEKDGVYAKLYKDAVEATQSNWDSEVAQSTLRFTGSRARGRQVAAVIGFWLTGDKQAVDRLPEGSQVLAGGPYDISYDTHKSALRTTITQLLTQTGIIISESAYAGTMLTKHNGRIKTILEAISDPTKATDWVSSKITDKSYCLWFVEDGQLKLEVQIWKA